MRSTSLSLVFVACLCTAFVAAGEAQAPSPLPVTDSAAFTISNDDVTRILEDRVDQMHKGVGIVVGLIDQTGTRVVSYGTADRKSHQPVNGDSVFEIGSITKVFTAILLADMVERGEVHLDDPISKYLPAGVRAPTRNGKEITLAHLSTHTSGLPRDAGNIAPLWYRLCLWCSDPGGIQMQMGLGWGINRLFDADIRNHSGGTGGYISYLGIDVKKRMGVVVLSNTGNDIRDIGLHLLESRVPLMKEHKAITLNRTVLDAYVGAYQMQPDVVLTISRRGDRLFSHRGSPGGGPEKLEIFAETETEFFLKAVNAQMTFTKDSAGQVTQVVIHHASGQDETGPKIK